MSGVRNAMLHPPDDIHAEWSTSQVLHRLTATRATTAAGDEVPDSPEHLDEGEVFLDLHARQGPEPARHSRPGSGTAAFPQPQAPTRQQLGLLHQQLL